MKTALGKDDLVRCLVVNTLVGLFAPFFIWAIHTAVMSPPGQALGAPDFQGVEVEDMSVEELEAHLNSPGGMREVTGVEKVLYPFTVPGAWRMYLEAAVQMFFIVFVACVALTAWGNMRRETA